MHARTFAIGSRRAARRSGIGMENCLQKSPTAERIDGYRVTLVRSDVFEKIRTLQKQQKPRIGAKELVTALLQAVLESPNATKLALKLVRAQRAEQLKREAECLERAADTQKLQNIPGPTTPIQSSAFAVTYSWQIQNTPIEVSGRFPDRLVSIRDALGESADPKRLSWNPDTEQQALLEQLLGKPRKIKADVASKVPTITAVELHNKLHESHFADDFFAWLRRKISQGDIQFNSLGAIAHTHSDGLLLVSPRAFRAFAETLTDGSHWLKVQKAILQSGNLLQYQRRHVHEYIIKTPGRSGKSMRCVVLVPDACKALLPPLPPANPMILGWAPSAV